MKKETFEFCNQVGIILLNYPPDFNKTDPTFIKALYKDAYFDALQIQFHKDDTPDKVINSLLQKVYSDGVKSGYEEGRDSIRKDLKTLLGIK